MKRTVALAILGLVGVTSAFGQGQISLSNYVSPYNSQVTFGGSPITAAAQPGLVLQAFFGTVGTAEGSLSPGVTFGINDALAFEGGGWYGPVLQAVPFTGSGVFQIRASGTVNGQAVDQAASRSVVWQIDNVASSALPPNLNNAGFGLAVVVPEPTTFALAGLGAAALLIFRRRD
jgi:hypothetical protein